MLAIDKTVKHFEETLTGHYALALISCCHCQWQARADGVPGPEPPLPPRGY